MVVPFRLRLEAAGTGEAPGPDRMDDAVEALAGTKGLDEETLVAFRKAVHLEPNDPDYHYILGESLVRLGRPAEALDALREAIQLNPNEASYRYAHGEALWELGRFDDAVADFREAVRLEPDDVRSLNALGAALARSGGEREAVDVLRAAIRREGSRASLHGNLGAALWLAGQHADALRALEKAVRLRPSFPDALRNLALALAAAGKPRESLKRLRQLVRSYPNDPAAHADLGDALYAAGRLAEASKALDEALRLEPASLRDRPRSQEARQAITLDRARRELKAEAATGSGPVRALWASLLAAPRAIARFRRGLALTLWLAVSAAIGYPTWAIARVYVSHHLLKDSVVEIARAPLKDEARIRERLLLAVRERGLEAQLPETAFEIATRTRWRTIRCRYEVSVELFPGLRRKLHLSLRVEQPYLAEEETLFH